MSRKKRDLTQDEKALWRRVVVGVKARLPLPAEEQDVGPTSPERVESEREASIRQAQASAPASKTPPRPKTPAQPADRSGEKRVRRGKLEIGGSLDLHGHTQESGRAALQRFLAAAHARGDRAVIVVTGKGRGGEGVLKRALPGWLAEPSLKPILSGYAPAHQNHGGAGAFYVFLKARRRND